MTISMSSSPPGAVGVPRIVTWPRRLPPMRRASRPCRRSSGSSNSSTAPCGTRSTSVRPPPSSATRFRSGSTTSVQGTRFTRPSGSAWYCLKSSRIWRLSSTIGSSRSHDPAGKMSPSAARRRSARARIAAACSGRLDQRHHREPMESGRREDDEKHPHRASEAMFHGCQRHSVDEPAGRA
ncbi:MAG: hypothetical protein EBX36_11835 [Planctomycetia bacterium]|nr:hypothetical protein [Planctomycetia bacterium]